MREIVTFKQDIDTTLMLLESVPPVFEKGKEIITLDKSGEKISIALIDPSDGRQIGIGELNPFPNSPNYYEVSLGVISTYRGMGMSSLLLTYIRDVMPTNIKLMFNIVAKGEERNRLVSALEKLGGHKSSHFPEFIEMDSTGTLQNPRITTVDIYFGIELSLLDTYGIYFDENQILHGDSCIGYVTEKGIQIASNLDNYFLYYDLFRRKGNLKILPASASAASAASA